MSRIDALRKVLYGGKRYVDTATETVLSARTFRMDAHSWGKEYNSVDARRLRHQRATRRYSVPTADSATCSRTPRRRRRRALARQQRPAAAARAAEPTVSHLGVGQQGKPGRGHRSSSPTSGDVSVGANDDTVVRVAGLRLPPRLTGSDELQALSRRQLQADRPAAGVRRERLDVVRPAHRLVHREQERRRAAQEHRLDHATRSIATTARSTNVDRHHQDAR